MARPADYVSLRFGDFLIATPLGSGVTREVFECVHLPTGVGYALKLHVEDDPLWVGEPLLPPANARFQRIEAFNAWRVMEIGFGGSSFSTFHQFRVVGQRYLQCVTAPFRPIGAWGIDRLLALDPPAGVAGEMVPIYDDALMMMVSEALYGEMDDATWRARWDGATGGPHLLEKASPVLAVAAPERQRSAFERLSAHGAGESELADNLVVRMVEAVHQAKMAPAEFEATLRSLELRRNVSEHEGRQLQTIGRAFDSGSRSYGSATLRDALDAVVVSLETLYYQDVLRDEEEPERFERIETDPPTIDDDCVVLQDMGARDPEPAP